MKKYLPLLFISVLTFSASAQQYSITQLDSIYNKYIQLREGVVRQAPEGNAASGSQHESVNDKCGFGMVNIIKLNLDRFLPEQQKVLRKILQRPPTDTSIVSPKGFFRIHFYKSGAEVPKFDVNLFAVAADSAYNFEINYLGYAPPPSDNGAGGDNRVDIYIINLGNLYGQTEFDTEVTPGSNRYTSFIDVDNDFAGFFTTGINAARVTIAHEFHHTIQVGNYIYRDSDVFYYELTSTSMEIFVYPSIKDYLQYLPSYFNNTDIGFAKQSGYNMAIWNVYLQKKFGYGIIKQQWELMPTLNALAAINASLTKDGSSFGKEFSGFGIWTYFTNYRSVAGKYFSDAALYPLVRPLSSLSITPPSKSVQVNTKAATNNFITFVNTSSQDTLAAMISNIDYQAGIDSPNASAAFQYFLYTDTTSGTFKLASKYSASLSVTKPQSWLSSEFLNNKLIRTDTVVVPQPPTAIAYAFPSPFYYGQHYSFGSQIFIPVSANNDGTADVNIYSVSMNLVYSNKAAVFNNNGHPVVSWNALSSSNKRLATGVYFYVTKSADNVIKGKLVIFNE